MVGFHRELFDRIVLIYHPPNPRVPPALAEGVQDDLRRRLPEMFVTVQPTRHAGHAREHAAAVAPSGRPLIIAVGDDGIYQPSVLGSAASWTSITF
jgi:diacylglycerol kinase (ATP)